MPRLQASQPDTSPIIKNTKKEKGSVSTLKMSMGASATALPPPDKKAKVNNATRKRKTKLEKLKEYTNYLNRR